MRPETLQSLSAGMALLGLVLAAVGGFGAIHFGREIERNREREKESPSQAPAGIVSVLPQAPQTPPSAVAPKAPEAPAEPIPPLSLAPAPSRPGSDILLPHLPISPPAQPGEKTAAHPPDRVEPAPPAPEIPSIKTTLAPPTPPFPSSTPTPVAPSASEPESPLTEAMRAILVQRLRLHPYQRLTIRAAADSPRALNLATALKSAFREAGWGGGDLEMVTEPLQTETLLLSAGSYPPPREFVAAYGALAGAGFLVTSDLGPKLGGQRVVLSVGPFR